MKTFLACVSFETDVKLEVSVHEVFLCLKQLKSKGPGPDDLPPWVLKDCAIFLAPAITFLLNQSLHSGNFPQCLKLANITPIPKVSNPSSIDDFRPISILPCLSKVFERVVLSKFILPKASLLIRPSQFAYIPRPGSGTTSPVVLLNHMILNFLDSASGAVRLLSVDFSKAFDSLSHSSILDACRQLSFNSLLVNWLQSFLSRRLQRVVVDGSSSSWVFGVPQGSVLGPVLFCIVMDHLSPACTNTKIVKYADDVVFLHFLRSSSDDNLLLEWNALVDWSTKVSLPINFNKCKVMDYVTKKSIVLSPIPISPDCNVPSVTSLTFLGVTFTNDFKWNAHFDMILRKAAKRIFILRNLRRNNCSVDLLWKVYESLLRSLFTYSAACFCNAPKYIFNKLVSFERRVCRICNISPGARPSVTRVIDDICNTFLKKIIDFPEHPLRVLFVPKKMDFTRSKNVFQHPRTRTRRFKDSFIKYCT